jgi:hypothetical protein
MGDVTFIFRNVQKDIHTGKINGPQSKDIIIGKNFPFSRHRSVKGGIDAIDTHFKKHEIIAEDQWIIGVTYKMSPNDAAKYGVSRCYGSGPDKVWDAQIGLTETFNSETDNAIEVTALRCIEEEVGLTTDISHINQIHSGTFGKYSECTLFVLNAKELKVIPDKTIRPRENPITLNRNKKAEVFIYGTYDEIKGLMDNAKYISLVPGCKDIACINGIVAMPYNIARTLRNKIDTLSPNGADYRPYFWPDSFPHSTPTCFSEWKAKTRQYPRQKFTIGSTTPQAVT